MESMTPVRVGVIGCGYWGPKLIRNLSTLPEAQLIAVADLDPRRLAQMARLFPGVRTARSSDELLRMDLDAVVVATPLRTHFKLASEVLLAEKHVLVEKPMAASREEATRLVALAEQLGLTLMVGHTFLFNPAVLAIKHLIDRGELGEIYYVRATRANLGLFQTDKNVIWDLAPHDFSILNFLLGTEPTSVSAHGEHYVQKGIEDVAYVFLRYPGGVTAQIHLSWLDPCKIRRITIVGSRKMLVYDDVNTTDHIRIYDKGVERPPDAAETYGEFQLAYRNGDIVIPNISWDEPLKVECQHFLHCVRTGERPRSDGLNGLQVVKALEAAQKSLNAGGRTVLLRPMQFDTFHTAEPASIANGNGDGIARAVGDETPSTITQGAPHGT